MSSNTDITTLHREAERLLDEISRIRESIKKLHEHRLALQSEISKLREEKNKVLEKVRSIKTSLRKLKEERRALIGELRNTVAEHRRLMGELRALKELISEKTLVWQSLSREAKLPVAILKKKIDEIEWEIQTKALTVEDEAKLVEKLRIYTSLYEKALAASKSREEVLELRAFRESLKLQVKELSKRIEQLRNSISAKNTIIEELRNELSKMIFQYNEFKRRILSLKEELKRCNDEIVVQISKLNALRQRHNEITGKINELKKAMLIDAKKEKIMQEASQRSKKRFSIEELKIMYGVLDEEQF